MPTEGTALKANREQIRRLIARLGTGPYEDGSSTRPGWTYQPIPVPGYEDIRSHKEAYGGMAEWEVVKDLYHDWKGKHVLDVGSNIGHYLLRLQALGANLCIGVEASDLNREIAHRLALGVIDGGSCIAYHKTLTEALDERSWGKFDVALMLNVLHWIVKQEGWDGAMSQLQKVAERTDWLLVSYPLNAADSMAKVDMRQDMQAWLSETTEKEVKGYVEYKFYGRTRYLCLLR